jgi:hypothetical protein
LHIPVKVALFAADGTLMDASVASQRLKLSLSCCNKKASSVKGRDICNLTGAEKSRNMDNTGWLPTCHIWPVYSLCLLKAISRSK